MTVATPILSSWLFWDSNLKKLDYVRDRDKVIRRVFELGLIEDIVEVLAFYSDDDLITSLTSAPYLQENAFLLARTLFHLEDSQFKCFTSKQFHPLS